MQKIDIKQLNFRDLKTYFYILGIFLMCCIFLKYVAGVPVPMNFLLFIFVLMVLCGDRNEILAACFCCIPLFTAFNHYYGTLFCLVIYLCKYYKEIRFGKGMIPVALIWFFEAAHFFCIGFSMKGLITFILPYLVCLVMMYCGGKKADYAYIIRIVSVCTLIICFIMFCILVIDYEFRIGEAFMDRHRLGMTLKSGEGILVHNANALGYFCTISITGLLQLIKSRKGYKQDLFLSLLLMAFGIMTMSKTFIMCMALLVVFFLVLHNGDIEAKKQMAKKAAYAMLGFGAAVALIMPKLVFSFLGRFFVANPTSGRNDLFTKFNGFIVSSFKNLFFGTGVSGLRPNIDIYFGESWTQVPHNGIQEILVVWGIPGLVLFGWFIYLFLKEGKRPFNKKYLMNYIPFILLVIKVQLGQLVTSYYTMMMLALCYLCICYDFESGEKTKFRLGTYLKYLNSKIPYDRINEKLSPLLKPVKGYIETVKLKLEKKRGK